MNEIDKLREEIVLLKLAIAERDDEIASLKEDYEDLHDDYDNLQDRLEDALWLRSASDALR